MKILNFDSLNFREIKKSQTILISIIFGILILITIIYLSSTGNKTITKNPKSAEQNKINFSNSLIVDAEKEWINKSETDLQLLLNENQLLKNKLSELETQLNQTKETLNKDSIHQIIQEINLLKQRQEQYNKTIDAISNNDTYSSNNNSINDIPTNLASFEFELTNGNTLDNTEEEYKSLEDYLPAGSYVSAKLISGVDASVGVSAQSDPRPVQFRITDYATTSEYNGKKQIIKKVKGCLVLGAASGDLSSEKVFVRLLKMTCSFKPNTTVEFDIKGYASVVGKAGIRGPVVSREGDLLVKSFWAGVVEGFGSTGTKALSPKFETSNGVSSYQYNAKDVGLEGLANGVETSTSKLSDYLIKRAEQYQPVISVSGGIDVELVFLNGVDLRNTNTIETQSETNNLSNSLQTLSNMQQNLNKYNTNNNSNNTNDTDYISNYNNDINSFNNINYDNNNNGDF